MEQKGGGMRNSGGAGGWGVNNTGGAEGGGGMRNSGGAGGWGVNNTGGAEGGVE